MLCQIQLNLSVLLLVLVSIFCLKTKWSLYGDIRLLQSTQYSTGTWKHKINYNTTKQFKKIFVIDVKDNVISMLFHYQIQMKSNKWNPSDRTRRCFWRRCEYSICRLAAKFNRRSICIQQWYKDEKNWVWWQTWGWNSFDFLWSTR